MDEKKSSIDNEKALDEDPQMETEQPNEEQTDGGIETNYDGGVAASASGARSINEDVNATATATATEMMKNSEGSNDGEQSNKKTLSKNQQKKIAKWQRKMQVKQRRKQQEKEARAAKAKAQGRDLEQERRDMEARTASGEGKQRRLAQWDAKMAQSAHSFQVCIDCHFENEMDTREINSLAQQLRYCYATNKRSPAPCYLAATGLNRGETLQHLKNVSGFEEWKTYAFDCVSESMETYYQGKLNSLVYLTSDSETVLETLESNKVYVIGGIVDRNRLKRAAWNRAASLGIATARLPLDSYLQAMESTRVLTVNHVFDILLHFKQHQDWQKAFQAILPNRKRATFASPQDPDNTVTTSNGEREGTATDHANAKERPKEQSK